MPHHIAEITCDIAADTKLLVEVFHLLKDNHINLRKVELYQNVINQSSYYLHMELDVHDHLPAHVSALETVRKRLESVKP